jgi:UDP-MurNAc hydroxylase
MKSPLDFTFIANACGIFKGSKGTTILLDPWLMDGVFEGSWCHWPPLATKPEDLLNVDAIFISHIHPDHFDERTFSFTKDIPIFILDRKVNFLARRLENLGYANVQPQPSGETFCFQEFEMTIFAPFTPHNFHPAEIGNVIDSALVISCEGISAFNANDNTPTPDSCLELRRRFGRFDLAMLNYNAAGPYPSCFDNLSESEKLLEHDRILKRNMDYLLKLIEVLQPRACLPFAGAYVLGGREAPKNRYLGTTTWDRCAAYLLSQGTKSDIITLREGTTINLSNLTADRSYVPLDDQACATYIADVLSQRTYDYESDPAPDETKLWEDVSIAVPLMLTRAKNLGLSTTFSVSLNSGEQERMILPWFDAPTGTSEHHLKCSLDSRLMRRILDREAQWNSSEIGCHINFFRSPNLYEPDLHTMLQFLHL